MPRPFRIRVYSRLQFFRQLLLLSALGFGKLALSGLPVTSAVGQVGPELLTSRKVILSSVIDRWKLIPYEQRKVLSDKDIKAWFLNESSEEFKSSTSSLMLEWMVALEAAALSTSAKSDAELAAEADSFLKSFKDSQSFASYEFSSEEIKKMLSTKDLSQKFLKVKMEASEQNISEEEVHAAYQRQKNLLAGVSFESVKPILLERLQREQQVNRLKDWFEILKRKYRVQYFGAHAP